MASLYKNNGIWYIAITHNGYRKCQSLKIKDSKITKRLKPYIESSIIAELNGIETRNENLSFPALAERFLHTNHNWSEATFNLINYILKSHLSKKPLPSNPTSLAIHIRHINQYWNWGLKNNVIIKI